ncbi:MAG: M20/M25/M40 family metallo-hydrolase [Alphaproteobacteria bacterium]|nr:M20/M25/M40 family metallo-hydrolase [Alphaproteobacteria bacterium]MBV9372384.1 M20/M25/M40 family metallo-hydrolase [Alphaproteobacteria bacterium]MBV9902175.1 M20/M25/M40 family metallo-hydrolase [Alphaproteobacteria bacterium]
MSKPLRTAAALPFLLFALAGAAPDPAGRLRDAALEGDKVAWDIVEDLTTEVGPRLAGTEAEARARDWAVKRLKALGFRNVHVEGATMATWVRGAETAEIVAPFPQRLVLAALGGSGATPPEGLTAEVVGFDSLDDLKAAPADAVRGRIVFVGHAMRPNQDGSGYGYYGPVRRSAPAVAARKGAAAVVIRSLGTDYHRNPHTGLTTWGEVAPIPAAALSLPDAENLQRMLKRAPKVTMHLTLTPRFVGDTATGNVVAEVPGTDPSAGTILIGGHLDSWDLGTGAIDDAAGVAITAAAAKAVMEAGRPRRTIRVIWFGDEETGGAGSKAYFAAHKGENVVFVAESDFGADRIWRFVPGFAPAGKPLADRIAAALFPLGINRGTGEVEAGADLGAWVKAGVAGADLSQDGTRYFDYHHTPDDTLDKVDPAQLRQNVAAWTAMLWHVANAREDIARVPAAPAAP